MKHVYISMLLSSVENYRNPKCLEQVNKRLLPFPRSCPVLNIYIRKVRFNRYNCTLYLVTDHRAAGGNSSEDFSVGVEETKSRLV